MALVYVLAMPSEVSNILRCRVFLDVTLCECCLCIQMELANIREYTSARICALYATPVLRGLLVMRITSDEVSGRVNTLNPKQKSHVPTQRVDS